MKILSHCARNKKFEENIINLILFQFFKNIYMSRIKVTKNNI